MYGLLRYVPKDHLSWFVGTLVHLPLPRPVAAWSIRAFAAKFGIDASEAARPIETYRSIGDFFVRDLKPGLRPIEGEIVSPVDAMLRAVARVDDGRLEQVKGRDYSLTKFLGDDPLAGTFVRGTYFNLYLSPRDYHHIHAPVRGTVVRSVHVPGRLWPVNDWSMESIPELFAVNERVITYLESRFGLVAVVMIGATNVGKMSVTYDDFVTNVPPREKTTRARDYVSPKLLEAGDRLGTFHMGSSVVVLFREGVVPLESAAVTAPCAVKMGQRLVKGDG